MRFRSARRGADDTTLLNNVGRRPAELKHELNLLAEPPHARSVKGHPSPALDPMGSPPPMGSLPPMRSPPPMVSPPPRGSPPSMRSPLPMGPPAATGISATCAGIATTRGIAAKRGIAAARAIAVAYWIFCAHAVAAHHARSPQLVAVVDVWTPWGRSGVNLGPICGPFGVEEGSGRGASGADPGRCGVGLGSV